MKRSLRLAYAATFLLVAFGCSKRPELAGVPSEMVAPPSAQPIAVSSSRPPEGFAAMPDRGELVAYPRQPARQDGAYTWHRTDLSEAHALNAIANGNLRLTTPSGQTLVVRYDHHIEHPSGDWTWVGHIPGQEGEQTILTFGPHAAFGSIAQPGKPPLRLTVRNGVSWLVETDPTKVAGIINAATRPQRPDYIIPPKNGVPDAPSSATSTPSMASAPAMAAATASASTTVDLVLGYTPAFASDNGGQSGAITRLNYLVDVTNVSYANSAINARVRLVATVPVSYPDNTSNDATLDELTGYDSSNNTTTSANPAFNGLRAAREQYGADLVSMVRSFRDPENGGCGVGWLIGGGQQGISTGDSYYGYSVVSDGSDAGTDGHTYFCLDETLAHELGHNMGAQHDAATAQGTDGVLNPGDYGVYSYSFGFKSQAGFYTIMAYGNAGQQIYRIFSDPRSTFCGGQVCGTSQADNARTLSQTIPTVAAFRATVVPAQAAFVRNDFNGDGKADVYWRNVSTGANDLWLMNGSTLGAVASVYQEANQAWTVVGSGDFNGDGRADVFWRNVQTGENYIHLMDGTRILPASGPSLTVADQSWRVVAFGDFDADGKTDIYWRNMATGVNDIWLMAGTTPRAVQSVYREPNQSWKVIGSGDFNGDGHADIAWRNASTGQNYIHLMNGMTILPGSGEIWSVPSLSWQVVAIGDFDGDGKADLYWRNSSSGENDLWLMNGIAAPQALYVYTETNQNWTIVNSGDYNGDGKADIFWRNIATGQTYVHLMRGAQIIAGNSLATVSDLNWKVTGR